MKKLTSQNWFTSDTHFGHENVIRYSDRPYKNKNDMDESLICNQTFNVLPNDNVFHIGDIFFCKKSRSIEILEQLNGKITLILGNHDKAIRRDNNFKQYFHQVVDYLELNIDNQKIVLSHYPMMSWNGSHRGSWMLHGHCHGSLKYPFNAKIHDCGVDPNNYAPVSFDTIKQIMCNKEISVIDHHTTRM